MGHCSRHGAYMDFYGTGRCPFCAPEPGQFSFTFNVPMLGWRCPVCGGGVAPHVERCPCVPLPEGAAVADDGFPALPPRL